MDKSKITTREEMDEFSYMLAETIPSLPDNFRVLIELGALDFFKFSREMYDIFSRYAMAHNPQDPNEISYATNTGIVFLVRRIEECKAIQLDDDGRKVAIVGFGHIGHEDMSSLGHIIGRQTFGKSMSMVAVASHVSVSSSLSLETSEELIRERAVEFLPKPLESKPVEITQGKNRKERRATERKNKKRK